MRLGTFANEEKCWVDGGEFPSDGMGRGASFEMIFQLETRHCIAFIQKLKESMWKDGISPIPPQEEKLVPRRQYQTHLWRNGKDRTFKCDLLLTFPSELSLFIAISFT